MNYFKKASDKYNVRPLFTLDAPNTFKELMKYKYSLVLPIYSGHNNKSIWGEEENLYFRFHHDLIHIKYNLDFTLLGEIETYTRQKEELMKLGMSQEDLMTLYYDIVGQRKYYDKHNKFVHNQKEFIHSCKTNGLEHTLKNGNY